MARSDPRGNPVSTASAQSLDATERALWRMMSFYGTPIDDLDAAIAADPAWPLPRLMKAGFLLSLTEPSLVDDARTLVASVPDSGAGSGNARERAHRAALVRLAAGDWAGAWLVLSTNGAAATQPAKTRRKGRKFMWNSPGPALSLACEGSSRPITDGSSAFLPGQWIASCPIRQ